MKLTATICLVCLLLTAAHGETVIAPNDAVVDDEIEIVARTFTDEGTFWDISVRYPEIPATTSSGFNNAAREMAMSRVEEFRKLISETEPSDLPEGMKLYTEVAYTIDSKSSGLVSVLFSQSEYSGGAHPNLDFFALNYDLEADEAFGVEMLFRPESGFLKWISSAVRKKLVGELGADADHDWIARGASPKLVNFEDWSLTKKGIAFSFAPYQVAAYVYGPFEVVIPYESFPREMRSDLFYRAMKASYVDGNPPNWCRQGRWTRQSSGVRLGTIVGNGRAHFFNDSDDCPNGSRCRARAYVIPGDELVVGRTYGDFVCSWYQPKKGFPTVGWIQRHRISFSTGNAKTDWLGFWEFGDSTIEISAGADEGTYLVRGTALWKGLGDNVHIGELDYSGKPIGPELHVKSGDDKYDCKVRLRRLGKFLIVSDNLMCGGVNVSFDGIYQRKRQD